MYYLQSRYYDPEIGGFINADVLLSGVGGSVQGCNTFAYCINNPVNLYDPMGLRGNTNKSKFTHKSGRILDINVKNTHSSSKSDKKKYVVNNQDTSCRNSRSSGKSEGQTHTDKNLTLIFGINLSAEFIIEGSL